MIGDNIKSNPHAVGVFGGYRLPLQGLADVGMEGRRYGSFL